MKEKLEVSKNAYLMIKHLCKIEELKIGDLEKTIGLTPGYLSRIGSGKRALTLEKAMDIANYFDITINDLINGIAKKTNDDVFCEVFGFSPWNASEIITSEWGRQEYTGTVIDPFK